MFQNQEDVRDRIINKAVENYGFVPDVLDFQLGSATLAVYATLCIYANKEGWAFPSIRTIAEKIPMSEDTAQRALKRLELLGLLIIERPQSQGRGQFNKYFIVDKRGAKTTPFTQEGVQKGCKNTPRRGASQGTEQYQRTIEQEALPVDNFSDKYEREKEEMEKMRKKMCGM